MKSGDRRRLYDGPAYSRLWEKSAIGLLTGDQGLLLTDSEVIFCREHRGVEFEDIFDQRSFALWLSERVRLNRNILREAAVLEALRVPGNKVVLSENFEPLGLESSDSWAMRWSSDNHPSRDSPVSEILWYESKDVLHDANQEPENTLENLLYWCDEVTRRGRLPEVLVIDEEQSVVTYRLSEADPNGDMNQPTAQVFESISEKSAESLGWNGIFISDAINWPLESIGIPLHGGRQLDITEAEIVRLMGKNVRSTREVEISISHLSTIKDDEFGFLSVSASILLDLWMRGLNTRSGFKYGTAWRCYSGDIGGGHAPWLVVDPSKEGPANWAEACLSSRLASGVNKHWLYPIHDGERWRYLQISRPPSDSRWSNPKRI